MSLVMLINAPSEYTVEKPLNVCFVLPNHVKLGFIHLDTPWNAWTGEKHGVLFF